MSTTIRRTTSRRAPATATAVLAVAAAGRRPRRDHEHRERHDRRHGLPVARHLELWSGLHRHLRRLRRGPPDEVRPHEPRDDGPLRHRLLGRRHRRGLQPARLVEERHDRTDAGLDEQLVTASNALTAFGPTKRFTTKVVDGSAADRVVIEGSGDPSLSSAQLDAMARTVSYVLTQRGLTVAPVRVYVDDDVFPTPSLATGWK